MSKLDYYAVLGVRKTDSQSAIKSAYYRLAQQYHPDKNRGDVISTEKFKEINEAYQVLSDVERRKVYDHQISGNKLANSEFQLPFVYYLKFTAEKTFIKQFEEVKVEFSFPSEARFFKRQHFNEWYIVEGPLVNHAEVVIDGIKRKETQISYRLAPLKTGTIVADGPSVVINNKRVTANPLYFTISHQKCVINNEIADEQPLILELEKEEIIKTKNFIKSKIKRRLLIIPLGKTYKRKQNNIRLLSYLAGILMMLVFYKMNAPAILVLLLTPLIYVIAQLLFEKFTHQPSIYKIINEHPMYLHLRGIGYKIARKHIAINMGNYFYLLGRKILNQH